MMYPRFRVATVTGFRIGRAEARRGGKRQGEGLSATVCDSLNLWKELRTYRSEDQVWRNGQREPRGVEGAQRDAEDHAAYLNDVWRREQHAERTRGYRAKNGAHG